MYNFVFNSHTNHNPDCDILCANIDQDTIITYCLNLKTNLQSMELYIGENYVVGSAKKSYSRIYTTVNIPMKYLKNWCALKVKYEKEYNNKVYLTTKTK